ncbi:MAG: transposase [Pseudonocardiaceae bacterium]
MNTAVANVADLEQALGEAFAQHPEAAIITNFPGLGTVLEARILGDIGDDRTRFADAKALKAFAGTAPITRASSLQRSVTMRVVRNRRLCHADYLWRCPCSPAHPEPAPTTTDAASAGTPTAPPLDTSPTVSSPILYHCLQKRISYDEAKAFPPDIKIAT